jgi:hypothetical protein
VGSPTNAILALKRFSMNSMRVYPLFAQTMTLRFTPYSGAHTLRRATLLSGAPSLPVAAPVAQRADHVLDA